MESSLSSAPSTSRLKGALRWSQAEDAAARINVVRSQVQAADRGSALRGDLAKGLNELESIRRFLQDGIQLSNNEIMKGGSRDQLLHDALEKGLNDLENVKSDLVNALGGKSSANAEGSSTRKERTPSARSGLGGHGNRTSVGAPAPPPRAPSGSNFSQQRRNMFFDRDTTSKTPQSSMRPTSAPVKKTDLGSSAGNSSYASLSKGSNAKTKAVPNPPLPGGGTSTSSNDWGRYQDWAQNVLNRVQSRRPQGKPHEGERDGPHQGSAAGDKMRKSLDQYEEEIQSDDGDDLEDENEGGEEDGLSRHGAASNHTTRTPRDSKPPFSAGINRGRPLSATMGRGSFTSPSGGAVPIPVAMGGPPRPRPESANFTAQQRNAHPPRQTNGSATKVRPSTAGMSVRSDTQQTVPGKLHPQAQALREQGNIYFQQKKYRESADAYGKAIQLFEPNSETLYCNRAAAYLMLNMCEEALADAQMAITIDPTHVKAHWRAAKACLYLGRSDTAKLLYSAAHKLAEVPTEADAIAAEMKAVDIAERCRRSLRLREYTEALRAAESLLEIFPINGPCSGPWICLKGEALVYTDAHEAGALLTTLCGEDPSNAEAWLIRGKALFYAAHDALSTQSALSYLNKARDLDTGKASVVAVNGPPGGAHSFLNTVAGRAASLINIIENFSKLRDMGNNAYAAGKWTEAYDAYTRCLTVDPCNGSLKAIILCNRSAVSIQCEKWKDAMDDINSSISLNNTNAKAFTRRARIHQHSADYDEAVRDLQTAVQMYPSSDNQERLQQAIEQQRAHQRAQQQRTTNASQSNAQARAGSYRFFGTSHDGYRMPRPNTAGAQRSQSAAGSGGGGGSSYSSFFSKAGAGSFFGGSKGSAGGGQSQGGGTSSSATNGSANTATRYYHLLSITKTADEKAVTRAYREAALKWHPDKWASGTEQQRSVAEATFKEINVAYSVLKDPVKRKQYDMGVSVS